MKRIIIPNGTRFGKLQVIGDRQNGTWLCQCDCGNLAYPSTINLRTGNTQSCGCLKGQHAKSLVGRVFGLLTVVARDDVKRNKKVCWICRCECGKLTSVNRDSLLRGLTKSCGCLRNRLNTARYSTHGQSKTRAYKASQQRLRTARRLRRTPPWSDLEAIRLFYERCPEGMTVDHIVPLKGKWVSGLHVPHNLQYLTPTDNFRKRNTFNPLSPLLT